MNVKDHVAVSHWNSQKRAVHTKHLCWSFFLKRRTQHRCFPVNIAKFLRTAFFIKHLFWLLLIVVPQHSKVTTWFDFAHSLAFDFDQKLTQIVAQVILYYHVKKQSLLCLNWLITCFRFQNMFWRNIRFFISNIFMSNARLKLTNKSNKS